MAILQGDQGSVSFDADGSGTGNAVAIAGTRSWTLNVTKSTIEATQQGQTFTKTLGSVVSGSGTIELVYDNDQASQDTLFAEVINAQDAADAKFELFTTGTSTGSNSVKFDGIITSFDISSTVGDLVVATCNFVTSGQIDFHL
jgi:hypothetical protein|tara:strand:- start:60 stop:488 length:429 start_codon:yes stop_codon:yes gene_type:complete